MTDSIAAATTAAHLKYIEFNAESAKHQVQENRLDAALASIGLAQREATAAGNASGSRHTIHFINGHVSSPLSQAGALIADGSSDARTSASKFIDDAMTGASMLRHALVGDDLDKVSVRSLAPSSNDELLPEYAQVLNPQLIANSPYYSF